MNLKPVFFSLIFLYLLNTSSQAGDIQQNMASFFEKMGGIAHTTAGSAHQDQTAGHYTGGSLYARNTVHNTQLATILTPGYRAGCGGIDLHFGALSYLSGEQLTQALRAIGSSMASYGLLLAIETMSPQVKNIMTELNDLAQKINMSNINSCKMAATTLGAILPRSDAANHHLCTMIGNDKTYGGFSDYAAANQGCGSQGKRNEVLQGGANHPKFAKMLGSEFNLAWKAIQENAFLNQDRELAEFFMSLSGTILSHQKDDGFEISSKASLVDRNSLLTTLLYGGSTTIYSCDGDTTKCLKLKQETLTIAADKSLVSLTRKVLIGIQNKIYEDTPLDKQEIAFLDSTKLPFYKILNVSTAYRREAAPVMVSEYAELAAVDVLFHYLEEIITVIEESVAHIKSAQVDDTQIGRFEEGLRQAKLRVYQKRMAGMQEMDKILSMIRKTEMVEKVITGQMGVIAAEGI